MDKFQYGSELNQFDDWWLHRIDEQGRDIWFADALVRLMADSFSDNVPPRWIELDRIYKFSELKQTGYQIIWKPISVSIIGGGKVDRLQNAVKIQDIKILFENEKEPQALISYISGKQGYLDLFVWYYTKFIFKKSATLNKFEPLGSDNVSMLLSRNSNWKLHKKDYSISGNINIFESDELLDQLVVYILILHARWGHGEAINILLALLKKPIDFLLKTQYPKYNDWDYEKKEDLMSTVYSFVSDVLQNEKSLASRFIFPFDGQQSLKHFLASPPISEKRKAVWYPKIQEHLKDLNAKFKPEPMSRLVSIAQEQEGEEDSMFINLAVKKSQDEAIKSNNNILIGQVKEFIKKWPKKQRQIFEMLLEGNSQSEIAVKLKVSKAYVSKVVKKGKQALLQKFKDFKG